MTFDSERLHPVRFRRAFKPAAEVVRQATGWPNSRFPHPSHMNRLQTAILDPLNDAIRKRPLAERPEPQQTLRALMDAMMLSWTWGWQHVAGRNNFVLSPELAILLRNTELGDVQLGDIEPPFNNLYLHFGGAEVGGLPGPENRLDGAYLRATGAKQWLVTFTTSLLDTAPAWPFETEPFLEVELNWSDPTETLADVFARGVADLEKVAGERVIGQQGAVQMRSGELAQDWGFVLEAARRCELALGLLGNALCYLSAEPEVSEPAPLGEVSPTVRWALDHGPKAAKQKAIAQLAERGFHLVRWLGPQTPNDDRRGESAGQSGSREVRSHWRRGHWRRQPHGVGRTERKLVWIRPAIISGIDKGDPPDRAYLVD